MRMSLNPMTGAFLHKEREIWTETQRDDGYVMAETVIVVMLLPAKESQGMLALRGI